MRKNYLIVVDAQLGFMTNELARQAVKDIGALLGRDVFDVVISSVYRNYENSPIIKLMGWDSMLETSEQSLDACVEAHSTHIIYKEGYSAVTEETAELLKRENGGALPECVYVVGLDTCCCVLSTALSLFEMGVRPIVLARYCGDSSGMGQHDAGLLSLNSLIGKNNVCYERITSKEQLEAAELRAKSLLNDETQPVSTETRVVNELIRRGWHITFAESCTGGLAAGRLVNVPDASRVFDGSFVTYSNDKKIEYLNVAPETIERYGVVSEAVALEMAEGAAEKNGAQVAVGISGIAGPGGATKDKPVGMVCFGFMGGETRRSYTMQFGAVGRGNVREKSVDFVFEKLLSLLG